MASWPVAMAWGEIDYQKPKVQLQMMKAFEEVEESKYISQIDTSKLWIADFNLWTTQQCLIKFERGECGFNQKDDEDEGYCAGTWTQNVIGLKDKMIKEDVTNDKICYKQNNHKWPKEKNFIKLVFSESKTTDSSY